MLCPQPQSTARIASPRVPFPSAARQSAVDLHVADLGLDAAAPAERLGQGGGQSTSGAADQDLRALDAVTAVAAVDDGTFRRVVGQDGHLFQRFGQGVAVVGVARQRPHADDEPAFQRGADADLGAEFVADAGLSFRDAVDLRLVERGDLGSALRRLVQQPRHQHELVQHPLTQNPLGDLVDLAAQVAQHGSGVTLELSQGLAHAPELSGVGVAADLRREPRRQRA